MQPHIPPDVLERIGALYVEFLETMERACTVGAPQADRIRHRDVTARLDATYAARLTGCDRPARYFTVEAGASYTIVAYDPNHAWLLFARELALTKMGDEMLDDYEITMTEMLEERVKAAMVVDERDGKEGRYPLTDASVGDVFSSEY